MDLRNSSFIHSVFLFLCIGGVHNRRRRLRTRSYDVSALLSVTQSDSLMLIMRENYPSERHSVITEDGYIVNLFRIPSSGPPVLLVHGIGDSSDCWLVLGKANSLAYLLADAGFDVWLFNSRGNKYSKRHTRNLSSKEYWNFSYEEMGSRDLPATIDYILQITSRQTLSYVGFSQGTTIFFVMGSMKPEYNDKIKHAVMLAPVAWVTRIKYPFIDILTQNLELVSNFADKIGLYELFPDNALQNLYHAKVCNSSSPVKVLCDLEYYISYGLRNASNLPSERLPVIASHIPAGSSTKTFVHFMQGYASKKFQRYNYYKRNENDKVYGYSQPASYDVSLVSAPLTLVYSEVDWYSDTADVRILEKRLPNIVNSVMLNQSLDFTHLEFVYGSRVKSIINDPIVSMLRSLQ